jgi:hypothetical protein
MTRSEFIPALKIQTSDAAVSGTISMLEHVPGRKPREEEVALSKWFNGLAASDRAMVSAALQQAAESAVFGFLCILDGVRVIENGPNQGNLRLSYSRDEVEITLNDPADEFLHDEYNYLCQNAPPAF